MEMYLFFRSFVTCTVSHASRALEQAPTRLSTSLVRFFSFQTSLNFGKAKELESSDCWDEDEDAAAAPAVVVVVVAAAAASIVTASTKHLAWNASTACSTTSAMIALSLLSLFFLSLSLSLLGEKSLNFFF